MERILNIYIMKMIKFLIYNSNLLILILKLLMLLMKILINN